MDSDITVNDSVYKNAGKLLLASSFFFLLLLLLTFFQSILQNIFHGLDLGRLQIWVCVTTKLTVDRLLK